MINSHNIFSHLLILPFLLFLSCSSNQNEEIMPYNPLVDMEFSKGSYWETINQDFDIAEEDFTLAVWVKTASKNTQMILQKGGLNGPKDPQYWLRLNDQHGALTFSTGNGDGQASFISSDLDVSDGEWHFIVASRAGESMTLWIDCESGFSAQRPLKNCSNEQFLKVGVQLFNGERNLFEGEIENLYIYKRELSKSELRKLFQETEPQK